MSMLIDKREKRYVPHLCAKQTFGLTYSSMLSLRVFGEDITKPHTATLRGKEAGEEGAANTSQSVAQAAEDTSAVATVEEEDSLNA